MPSQLAGLIFLRLQLVLLWISTKSLQDWKQISISLFFPANGSDASNVTATLHIAKTADNLNERGWNYSGLYGNESFKCPSHCNLHNNAPLLSIAKNYQVKG